MDAVGIGASNRELRTPCFFTSLLRISHSQRLVGVTPHMSNWKIPLDTGEPLMVWYGPSTLARSLDAVMDAK